VALAAVAVPTVAGAKRTASDDRAAHARHGVHHSAKKTHRPKAKKAKWARKRSDDRAHAARRGRGTDDATEARRGADDPPGDDRGGATEARHGADDPPGDDHGGHGSDDGEGHS